MLPDWDFNGDDAKRLAFIRWAVDELMQLNDWCALRWMKIGADDMRAHLSGGESYLAAKIYAAPRAHSGQPKKPIDFSVIDGMDAALRDMGLLKWIFQQNYPKRLRLPANDPANAAYIAAQLHWSSPERRPLDSSGSIEPVLSTSLKPWVLSYGDQLNDRFKNYPKCKGRLVAKADIAYITKSQGNPYSANGQ